MDDARAAAPSPATTSTAAVETDWAQESCGFYALPSGTRCRQRRSCYDCLNVPVASEPKGCLLSPYGACESMDAYSPDMDYRRNDSSTDSGDIENPHGGWWHIFPSANSTYCEAQDSACVRCREIAVNASRENSYMASTSKFCRGVDGCVCIVGCEAPTWKNRVQQDCRPDNTSSITAIVTAAPASTPLPTGAHAAAISDSSHQLIWYLAIAQVPIFTLLLVIRARWLRHRRKKRKTPMHRLELSGWRAMHAQLVERDKDRPPHAESVLHSALPPLAPSATEETARPPLMTRAERNVWTSSGNSTRIATG